jgi:hypothetical protein
MEILCSAQQAHTCKQANQTKIMITMQVRNKDVADFTLPDLVFGHLQLGAFAAVD